MAGSRSLYSAWLVDPRLGEVVFTMEPRPFESEAGARAAAWLEIGAKGLIEEGRTAEDYDLLVGGFGQQGGIRPKKD